ncbi:Nuclear import receptor [Teratosphaeriaceae sp. CCFEE 6253]|nr:Nuclear import receptor [Teratosphaeriaceae sp. CCFEE 6253]
MVLSYRTHTAVLLPQLAEKLAAGFQASRQGCFLWATDSIVREFSADAGGQHVPAGTAEAIFAFWEQQATTFLRALSDLPPEELPDVIEDFFRLAGDVLLYHADRLLSAGGGEHESHVVEGGAGAGYAAFPAGLPGIWRGRCAE